MSGLKVEGLLPNTLEDAINTYKDCIQYEEYLFSSDSVLECLLRNSFTEFQSSLMEEGHWEVWMALVLEGCE